jgi:hypothetical protein
MNESIKRPVCQYCKKSFANKSTLKTHQSLTKYCLRLRDSEEFSIAGNKVDQKTFQDYKKLEKDNPKLFQDCNKVELIKKENKISINFENQIDKYSIYLYPNKVSGDFSWITISDEDLED